MPRRRRGNPDTCPVLFLFFLLIIVCIALQLMNATISTSVYQGQYRNVDRVWSGMDEISPKGFDSRLFAFNSSDISETPIHKVTVNYKKATREKKVIRNKSLNITQQRTTQTTTTTKLQEKTSSNNQMRTFMQKHFNSTTESLKLMLKTLGQQNTTLPTGEKQKMTEHTSQLNTTSKTHRFKYEHAIHGFDRLRRFQLELPIPMTVNRQEALLYGHFRKYLGFLTLGLPSVSRMGISYLEDTLDSIVSATSEEEKTEVTVVLFLTDNDHDVISRRAKVLYTAYKRYVDSGFIQIAHPHRDFYPDFNKMEVTMNDSRKRAEWRSKQNIDYAYLSFYSEDISEYYIQLEDDIMVKSGYVHDIKDTIDRYAHKEPWFVISFAKIGFIGKLIHSKDLNMCGNYLLLFYFEQPGDLLFNFLRLIKSQDKEFVKKPSLFQHKGVISSLEGKIQNNVDKFYGRVFELLSKRKQFHIMNPEADIFTTIHYHHSKENMPEFAYDRSDRVFIGHNPKPGDNFTIIFHELQNITRIYIRTGVKKNGNDYLHTGDVLVSTTPSNCTNLKRLGSFSQGLYDMRTLSKKKSLKNIACLVIIVKEEQKEWLSFKEIAIFR